MKSKISIAICLLLTGCAHRVVQGDPTTLPTVEARRHAIVEKHDAEQNFKGDFSINERGWVLVHFPNPGYVTAPKCNITDLSGNEKIGIKRLPNEREPIQPDGMILTGKPGDRLHVECLGPLKEMPKFVEKHEAEQ